LPGDGDGGGERDASAPAYRYFAVLVLMLLAVVFLIAAPIKLEGGSGGPVRVFALVEQESEK